MTQTIEQLQAKVAELEEENARLKVECDDIKQVQFPRKLEAVAVGWKRQLTAAQEENGRLENQVLARDAELWGRTQEILGLKDQLAKAEQRVAEAIVDMLQQKHRNCFGAHSFYLAASVATANGEWRKFVKEM